VGAWRASLSYCRKLIEFSSQTERLATFPAQGTAAKLFAGSIRGHSDKLTRPSKTFDSIVCPLLDSQFPHSKKLPAANRQIPRVFPQHVAGKRSLGVLNKKHHQKVTMVVAVFTTNCHVSEYWKCGAVPAHNKIAWQSV